MTNRSFSLATTWIACTAAAAMLLAAPSHAQQIEDNKGTEFWLMFNDNNSGGGNIDLFITGDIATTGLVEVPGLGFSQAFAVTPGTVTTVDLASSTQVLNSDVITNLGVHVTSVDEVTVYGLNQKNATTDAYLGLPVDILGTEYITLGYESTFAGSQFGIVAPEDNTTVTVTPSQTVGARVGGVAYNLTMNQAETYQLTMSPSGDLSGSVITSDKPIAVFAGHRCVNIPSGFAACDHIVEQMPPTSTWGRDFVTFPLATRLNGDTFRVLASEDSTALTINGAVVTSLDRGGFFETILTDPSVISADKPVLVAQYSNGTLFDGVTSDPFEALVPPSEQFLAGYTVSTPATGISINFINVLVPNAAVGDVEVDGVPVPPGDYTPIGTSGFSGASMAVALGSHTLSGPLAFGVLTYGFDQADSYGYPGGLALGQVVALASLDISPLVDSNPVGVEACVAVTTLDPFDDPVPSIGVTFDVTGANPNSGFVSSDAQGVAEYCYVGNNPGNDTIVATSGILSVEASKTWGASAVVIDDWVESILIDRDGEDAAVAARSRVDIFANADTNPVLDGSYTGDGCNGTLRAQDMLLLEIIDVLVVSGGPCGAIALDGDDPNGSDPTFLGRFHVQGANFEDGVAIVPDDFANLGEPDGSLLPFARGFFAAGNKGLQILWDGDCPEPGCTSSIGADDPDWGYALAVDVIQEGGFFDPEFGGEFLAGVDQTIVAVATTEGLQIIDVSDLDNPVQLSQLDLNPLGLQLGERDAVPQDVVVSRRGFAYVSLWALGILVVDVNDPSNPQVLSLGDLPLSPMSAFIKLTLSTDQTQLYGANGFDGLAVFNVTLSGALNPIAQRTAVGVNDPACDYSNGETDICYTWDVDEVNGRVGVVYGVYDLPAPLSGGLEFFDMRAPLCGLIGIEPFLIVPPVLWRRLRRRRNGRG